MKKIFAGFLLITALFVVAACGINSNKERNYTDEEKDLIQHVNEIINFDLTDYVLHASGEYNDEPEYNVDVEFEVDDSSLKELKEKLNENIGIMPEGFHWDIFEDDSEVTIIEKYHNSRSGKIRKTIFISCALYTKNNKTYMLLVVS